MEHKFFAQEKRILISLVLILAVRMIALFIIYPVFATSASSYKLGNSELLVSLGLGAYGISQAIMQIPFGLLSDKIGRKPVIFLGLSLLAIGGFVAHQATSLYGVIIGRIIQGSGAIGCVIQATVADNTREAIRSKSMAILGASIGFAFFIAILLGPIIDNLFGLRGIFLCCSIFAFVAIIITNLSLPRDKIIQSKNKNKFLHSFKTNKYLNLCFIGVFASHATFTGLFLVLPKLLSQMGYNHSNLWKLYSTVLFCAFLATILIIGKFDRSKINLNLIKIAICGMLIGQVLFLVQPLDKRAIIFALILFFTGFSLIEAILPAAVSKIVDSNVKGVALGTLSSLQFLGMALGSVLAGWLQKFLGNGQVIIFGLMMLFLWLIFVIKCGWQNKIGRDKWQVEV